MIDEETVFILGAGASRHHNYPTGDELREFICGKLNDVVQKYLFPGSANPLIIENKERYKNLVREMSDDFDNSHTAMIDLYISRNPTYEAPGKTAIVVSILEAEGKTKSGKFPSSDDWYFCLFNRLTKNLTKPEHFEKYKDNKVSFITFNYDRSLENYLYNSIIYSFKEHIGRRPLQENEILPFPIIHVYGQVALLLWQSDKGLEYAPSFHPDAIALSKNIRVIHERADDRIIEATELIKNAKRIFFLGFGYAEENMNVLQLPEVLNLDQKIFGTTLGLTDNEKKNLKSRFVRWISSNTDKKISIRSELADARVVLKDLDCNQLLKEYL